MKILLVFPPYSPESMLSRFFEPLGLEIIGASVRGHTVRLIDMRLEPLRAFLDTLREFVPDVVGFSVNSTIQVNTTRRLQRIVRTFCPSAKVVVGGNHPSLTPEDFYLKDTDAIFIGLAEQSFPRYIESLLSGETREPLAGVMTLHDGIPDMREPSICPVDVARIPFPDRGLTARYRRWYRDELRRRTALVSTSHGCPFRCRFCACWKVTGGKYLVRRAADVVEEIQRISPEEKHVYFADDNTFHNVKRAAEICGQIGSLGIRKTYMAFTRSDTVVNNPALFGEWRKIGLESVVIGVEAVDDESLKRLNKSTRAAVNEEAISILSGLGVHVWSYFLVEPDFGPDDFSKISRYIERHNLMTPMFTMLTPFPGTELYEEKRSVIDKDYDFFDGMHWVYPIHMQTWPFFREYYNLFRKAYSVRRHMGIAVRRRLSRLGMAKQEYRTLRNLPLTQLLLLRLAFYPVVAKLRGHCRSSVSSHSTRREHGTA